jgi:RPA family protein
MSNEMKNAMIASVETVEAIDNLITDWWSIEKLYETAAKTASVFASLREKGLICDEDYKTVTEFYEQHLMMVSICKESQKKGGEA